MGSREQSDKQPPTVPVMKVPSEIADTDFDQWPEREVGRAEGADGLSVPSPNYPSRNVTPGLQRRSPDRERDSGVAETLQNLEEHE